MGVQRPSATHAHMTKMQLPWVVGYPPRRLGRYRSNSLDISKGLVDVNRKTELNEEARDAVTLPFNSDEAHRFNATWASKEVVIEIGNDGALIFEGHYGADGGVSGSKLLASFPLEDITCWKADKASGTFQLVTSNDLKTFTRVTLETAQPAAVASACALCAEQRVDWEVTV